MTESFSPPQDANTDFSKLSMEQIDEVLLVRYAFDEVYDPMLKEKLTDRIFKEKKLIRFIEDIKSAAERHNLSSPEAYMELSTPKVWNPFAKQAPR